MKLTTALAVCALGFGLSAAHAQTFSSSGAITIPTGGIATPYPSIINVSGVTSNIEYLTVTLEGLTHAFSSDLEILLVAPGGQKIILMRDVGSGIDYVNQTVVFAADGQANIGSTAAILPSYRPGSSDNTSPFPVPAPAGPYSSDLSTLYGTSANGTWTLYVNDDATPDGGGLGVWRLSFNGARVPQVTPTSFTYQGKLTGVPANSAVDMRFALWDHPTSTIAGDRVSSVITYASVPVTDGLVTTAVDFGEAAFSSKALWLEVQVRTAGTGTYTTLTPRQPFTGTPYAHKVRGLTIDSANRVGVGVENPGFTLDVNGRSRFRGTNGAGGSSPGLWFASPDADTNIITDRAFFGMLNDDTAGLYVDAWNLTLNRAGNVGIGLNGPNNGAERLTVNGGVQINTVTNSRLAFGPVGDFAGGAENSDAVFFQRVNALAGVNNVSTLRLALGDDGITPASVDAFSIGYVTGGSGAYTERFRFNTDGAALKPGGGQWGVLSDARAKTDIADAPAGSLDRLLSLHARTFSYTPEAIATGAALPGTQLGFVAQEVEQVFPDWVGTLPGGMKYISEKGVTALTVEALRDLRAEKDRQIEALKTENAELARRLAELEALIRTQSRP